MELGQVARKNSHAQAVARSAVGGKCLVGDVFFFFFVGVRFCSSVFVFWVFFKFQVCFNLRCGVICLFSGLILSKMMRFVRFWQY